MHPVTPPSLSTPPQTRDEVPPVAPSLGSPPAITTEQTRLQRYIPKELLNKLNAALSGGGLTGERRVVTMLFCDVKGSTAEPPSSSTRKNGQTLSMARSST